MIRLLDNETIENDVTWDTTENRSSVKHQNASVETPHN